MQHPKMFPLNFFLEIQCMVIVLCVYSHTSVGFTIPSSNAKTTQPSSKNFPSSITPTAINIPWLIVGGGIHGVHISARLIGNNIVHSSDICIVDDHDALLQNWKTRTRNTGMKYLRSSVGYHLDTMEDSLRTFSFQKESIDRDDQNSQINKNSRKKKRKWTQTQTQQKQPYFSNDYKRPRLDFFNEHCDSVISKYDLNRVHTKGRVQKIQPFDDYVEVHVSLSDSKEETIIYHANQIVLALGNDNPSYVDWVDEDDIKSGFVRHLLDEHFDPLEDQPMLKDDKVSVAIVGGGITAAHKALELSHKPHNGKKSIHLISRHPLKEQQFDTHQHWMIDRAASKRSKEGGGYGLPERQVKFRNCQCWKERRKIIAKERIPGTITPAVNRGEDGLRYAIQNRAVEWHQADVIQKTYITKDDETPQLELTLSCGEKLRVDHVLLATGFGKQIPGGALVQDLIKGGMKVSEFCGYPIVDENLHWGNHVYVAGALAELELGPSARNIAGARLAAERIAECFL